MHTGVRVTLGGAEAVGDAGLFLKARARAPATHPRNPSAKKGPGRKRTPRPRARLRGAGAHAVHVPHRCSASSATRTRARRACARGTPPASVTSSSALARFSSAPSWRESRSRAPPPSPAARRLLQPQGPNSHRLCLCAGALRALVRRSRGRWLRAAGRARSVVRKPGAQPTYNPSPARACYPPPGRVLTSAGGRRAGRRRGGDGAGAGC
jgi:hypothetical protein